MKAKLPRSQTRIVAVFAAVSIGLAGCASSADGPAEVSGDAAATAQEVEELVFALSPPDPESNRMWAVSPAGMFQMEPYAERLLGNDPVTGESIPELAVAWEISDDFTEWTFDLRQGVQFHHGWGEFTAKDVAHSIEMAAQESSVIPWASTWASAEVQILGDYEIVIKFPQPNFFAEDNFNGVNSDGMIMSKAQWDAEGVDGVDARPAGTGHFIYSGRALGEDITYERNTEHWSGTQANFERIKFRWDPEDSSRLALVQTGAAHITDVTRELHSQAFDAGLESVQSGKVNHQSFLVIGGLSYGQENSAERPYKPNMDIPWVADVRVRQALNKALDRDAILEVIYEREISGAVEAVNTGWTQQSEGWNDDWIADFDEYYGYDPERAVELIREAGYEPSDLKPKILSFTLGGSPEISLLAELVQSMWQNIGINATIEETQWTSITGPLPDREPMEGSLHHLRNTPIRPAQSWHKDLGSEGSRFGMFNTTETEELFKEWEASTDPVERDRIARQVGDLWFYGSATIPMAEFSLSLIVDPSVVSKWVFPGVTSRGLTHFELIEPAS